MEMKKDSSNWLYPDLFTKNELVDILDKRYIKHTNINSLSKDELVDLYNKYVLPLPQRKHRLNRRGREMTKKQVLRAKKRKSTIITAPGQDDGQALEKRKLIGTDLNSVSTSTSSSSGDRLKPPPSCINFEKKTLKLKSGPSSQSDSPIDKSLDKLKINQHVRNSENKIMDGCCESKKIKLKVSTDDTKKALGDVSPTETTVTETNKKTEPMDTSDSKEELTKPKKIKIKRIAWP